MNRRRFLGTACAAGAAALIPGAVPTDRPGRRRVYNVRDYGARGDGSTNDTAAFQRVSRAVMDAGGGTISIPRGVYVVGRQRLAGAA